MKLSSLFKQLKLNKNSILSYYVSEASLVNPRGLNPIYLSPCLEGKKIPMISRCEPPEEVGEVTIILFIMYFRQFIDYPTDVPDNIRKIHSLLVNLFRAFADLFEKGILFNTISADDIWVRDFNDSYDQELSFKFSNRSAMGIPPLINWGANDEIINSNMIGMDIHDKLIHMPRLILMHCNYKYVKNDLITLLMGDYINDTIINRLNVFINILLIANGFSPISKDTIMTTF
jgi:hypothetical protein